MPRGQPDDADKARWRRILADPLGPVAVFRQLPGLIFVPAVFFIAAAFGSAATQGPILCLFRLVSGVPCAGCGMTRAFVAIANGQVGAAIDYNPLSPVAWLWMAIWWLIAVVTLARGRPVPPHPNWLLKIGFFTLAGWWAVRALMFLLAPEAWQGMVEVSPLMRGIDALL